MLHQRDTWNWMHEREEIIHKIKSTLKIKGPLSAGPEYWQITYAQTLGGISKDKEKITLSSLVRNKEGMGKWKKWKRREGQGGVRKGGERKEGGRQF